MSHLRGASAVCSSFLARHAKSSALLGRGVCTAGLPQGVLCGARQIINGLGPRQPPRPNYNGLGPRLEKRPPNRPRCPQVRHLEGSRTIPPSFLARLAKSSALLAFPRCTAAGLMFHRKAYVPPHAYVPPLCSRGAYVPPAYVPGWGLCSTDRAYVPPNDRANRPRCLRLLHLERPRPICFPFLARHAKSSALFAFP